jgi:hypothetical protein
MNTQLKRSKNVRYLVIDRHGRMNNVPVAHILKGNKTLCKVAYNKNNLDHEVSSKPVFNSFGELPCQACQKCVKLRKDLVIWNPRMDNNLGKFQWKDRVLGKLKR